MTRDLSPNIKYHFPQFVDNYEKVDLVLPLSDGKNLAYLHEYDQILNEDFKDDGVHVTVRLSPKDLEKFKTKTV